MLVQFLGSKGREFGSGGLFGLRWAVRSRDWLVRRGRWIVRGGLDLVGVFLQSLFADQTLGFAAEMQGRQRDFARKLLIRASVCTLKLSAGNGGMLASLRDVAGWQFAKSFGSDEEI